MEEHLHTEHQVRRKLSIFLLRHTFLRGIDVPDNTSRWNKGRRNIIFNMNIFKMNTEILFNPELAVANSETFFFAYS